MITLSSSIKWTSNIYDVLDSDLWGKMNFNSNLFISWDSHVLEYRYQGCFSPKNLDVLSCVFHFSLNFFIILGDGCFTSAWCSPRTQVSSMNGKQLWSEILKWSHQIEIALAKPSRGKLVFHKIMWAHLFINATVYFKTRSLCSSSLPQTHNLPNTTPWNTLNTFWKLFIFSVYLRGF